ncbi:MAG: RES family NAD+ phosphorylase [Chroococcidiopsidaceae cyanobacterium CP_BM_ER_R8_30]|nr:RES family NAD+ phosphorylase [Chroococcidiopsidaceae cyanobacterium CP_BM_ER_R8_30]
MRAWRVTPAKHAATAFSGEGARQYGGRWNSVGTPVVYCSAYLSLAILETLVHIDQSQLGRRYVYFKIEIPDTLPVQTLTPNQLPLNWQEEPAPLSLAIVGDDWVRQGKTAVLVVPSAILSQENNIILNPNHSDFTNIRISIPEALILDPRLK